MRFRATEIPASGILWKSIFLCLFKNVFRRASAVNITMSLMGANEKVMKATAYWTAGHNCHHDSRLDPVDNCIRTVGYLIAHNFQLRKSMQLFEGQGQCSDGLRWQYFGPTRSALAFKVIPLHGGKLVARSTHQLSTSLTQPQMNCFSSMQEISCAT